MKISTVRKRALVRELRKIHAVLEDDKIPPRIAIVRTYLDGAGSRFRSGTKKTDAKNAEA
jgi:hypothetical protein